MTRSLKLVRTGALLASMIVRTAFGLFCGASASAAGLDGSGYVQIAPTFNGTDGNTSYIRLSNDGSAKTTFTVKMVGSPSGTVYGTGTVEVAAGVSKQFALADLVKEISASALASGDTSYSVYLQDTDSTAFFQHAIYNGGNGFFENMSTCKYASSGNYTGLNSRLANVHTTRNGGYRGIVTIHNYAASSITYTASIYDATTGTLIGTVPVTVAANATNSQNFSWYEEQMKWTPTTSQYYVNIVFTAPSTTTYQASVNHYVYNSQFSAYVNMTQRCPTAATAVSTATSCPSSNFLTVTADSHNSAYAAPSLSVSCK